MLNHTAVTPVMPGGTRHYDQAKELIKQGHQVSIFASGFSHRTKREEKLERRQNYRWENVDGVEFIWVRTFPYKQNDWRRVVSWLNYSFRTILLGLRLKEVPDVILASSPDLFAGLAGYLLARAKRACFIFEIRDLWPETLVTIGGYSKRNLAVIILRLLEKFLYRKAKKIIVLHPKASDYITRLGIPDNKIVHIPNGVRPELFSDTGINLPEELDEIVSGLKSQGKLLVGYTGAHGIANALDTIIEAAKLLQDEGVSKVHFLMVGDGPGKEELVRRVRSWGLDNITFYKSISKYAIPQLLRMIDIAVISWKKSDL